MKLSHTALASTLIASLSLVAACATGRDQNSTADTETSHTTDRTDRMEQMNQQEEQPGTTAEAQAPQSSSSSGSSSGAGNTSSTQSTSGQMNATLMTHEKVLNQLHHLNQKEIEMIQLAQGKSQSEQMKTANQQVLSDHQALQGRVETIAKNENIQLKKFQPATYEKAVMDRLNSLEGSQFDQAFMKAMDRDHQAAMQQLRTARSEVQDPQIRSLIDETLPKLRAHHQASSQMHQQMDQQMSGTAADIHESADN